MGSKGEAKFMALEMLAVPKDAAERYMWVWVFLL